MMTQATIPLRGFDLAAPPLRAGVTRIAFPAFLLANAVLFLRPAEIISSVEGLPIYQFLTLFCIAICLPQVASQLSNRQRNRAPITVCVVGLLFAAVFSHLNHAD